MELFSITGLYLKFIKKNSLKIRTWTKSEKEIVSESHVLSSGSHKFQVICILFCMVFKQHFILSIKICLIFHFFKAGHSDLYFELNNWNLFILSFVIFFFICQRRSAVDFTLKLPSNFTRFVTYTCVCVCCVCVVCVCVLCVCVLCVCVCVLCVCLCVCIMTLYNRV